MAPLIASSGAGTPPLSEKASRKSRGPPFRFQPERDIASSLPAFLFLPSKKYLPASFFFCFFFFFLFFFVSRRKTLQDPFHPSRNGETAFVFFFLFFFHVYVCTSWNSLRFGDTDEEEGDSRKYAADENNPPIDDCVAIGMLENIIGE